MGPSCGISTRAVSAGARAARVRFAAQHRLDAPEGRPAGFAAEIAALFAPAESVVALVVDGPRELSEPGAEPGWAEAFERALGVLLRALRRVARVEVPEHTPLDAVVRALGGTVERDRTADCARSTGVASAASPATGFVASGREVLVRTPPGRPDVLVAFHQGR